MGQGAGVFGLGGRVPAVFGARHRGWEHGTPAAPAEGRPRELPRNWAAALRLRLQGGEHGLGQALALEAAAGELGVGHLGQNLEPRSVCVGFLDHGE